jgi:hypothetical protein
METFRLAISSIPFLSPFLVFGSNSSSPAEEQCSNRWLLVAASAEIADVPAEPFCESARWAIDQMASCGLATEQKLTVEIVDDLRHPCGVAVVGKFDPDEFRVQLASPSQCRKLAKEEASLAEVDFEALYRSILVHEVIHALLWKQLDHLASEGFSAIAAEYVAYAFQLLSLPDADRDRLLAAFPREPPRDLGPFNSTALLLSPMRFATNAYRHFMSVEDRCEFLGGIISGEIEFDDWDQYE